MKQTTTTLSAMKEASNTRRIAARASYCFLFLLLLAGKSFAVCSASFTYSVYGTSVQFTNTSQANNAFTSQWSFGDGTSSTQQDPLHLYNSYGPFVVCLTIYDSINCQSTYCDSIYFGIFGCQAYYTYSQNGFDFNFFNYSTGNYTDVNWDFGDGTFSTQNNPTHVFPSIGYYQVYLTISDSNLCNSTYGLNIYVAIDSNQQCLACFTVQVANSSASFSDCSQTSNQIIGWLWDFGDGTSSTQTAPVHTYNGPGAYLVCLTINDYWGCSSTVCDTLYINNGGGCQANFWESINGSSVQFYDQSTGNNYTTYWTFGDGASSYLTNPSHTYANNGTYQACLTIYDSLVCQSSVCHSITIGGNNNNCNANFILIPDSAQTGLYYGYNLSTGVNLSYTWTWGDGTSSTGQYPSHVYADSGYYNICLFISDALSQCSDTFCVNYYILKLEGLRNIHEVIFLDLGTGLPGNSPQEFHWSVFPNPASNSLRIETDASLIEAVKLLDLSGKVIETFANYEGDNISIEALPDGVYIIECTIEGGLSTQLLVKQ